MNRLTRWNGKKYVLPQGAWREIAGRLAAYENTGLEPEEIEALKAGRTPEKVTCDCCTDKGHCPEYKSGAACIADRKEVDIVKITKQTVAATVKELRAAGKTAQEIEDEFKAALKARLITVDVYSDAMIAIYGR